MLKAVGTVNDSSPILLAGLSSCAPKLTGSLGSSLGGWASPALQSSGEERHGLEFSFEQPPEGFLACSLKTVLTGSMLSAVPLYECVCDKIKAVG